MPMDLMPSWVDSTSWQRDLHLNTEAGSRQVAEFQSQQTVQRDVAIDAGDDSTQETYVVSGAIALSNLPETQAIVISTETLGGELYRVVTPLLSNYAYLEGQMENTTGHHLISGPANIYLQDEFVGLTTIAPTAAGQKLRVGFGADRQIRTRRELMSQKETPRGGNKLTEYRYRLVVANYHDEEIPIRLMDRIPVSSTDGSITILLKPESSDKLSTDALYTRLRRPTGILRWDLDIPPRQFGSDAFDLEYDFSIELARDASLLTGEMARNMQNDIRFNKTMGGGGFGGGGSF